MYTKSQEKGMFCSQICSYVWNAPRMSYLDQLQMLIYGIDMYQSIKAETQVEFNFVEERQVATRQI